MTNFNQISKKYYRKAKHEMPLCYAESKLYLAELSETLHAIEAEQPYHEEGARRHHCRCSYDLLCSWLCRLYDLKQTNQITLHRCNPRTCGR